MNVGNRSSFFGGILQSGQWVDNVRVFNGYYTPAEIGATSEPPVNNEITITTQPSNAAVSSGSTVTFTVVAQSTPPMTYQWQKDTVDLSDGGRISGATTSTLQISNVEESDEGTYRCVIQNGYDTETSAGATLGVNPTVAVGRQTLYESGTGRRYILYVPVDYTAAKAYPLIVSSHGTAQNGDTEMDDTGPNGGFDNGTPTWPTLAEENDVIVVCPDMTGAYGESGCAISSAHATQLASDDIAVMAIINEVEGIYNINTSRILLTGFSGGGNVVHYVGLRHPDIFRATCARHGNFHTALVPSSLPSRLLNMPVYIFTGSSDPTCGTPEAIAWYTAQGFSKLTTQTFTTYPSNVHTTDRHHALSWFLSLSGSDITIDSRWINFRGQRSLLIGDSITQGWMECGPNFNYTAYLDALAVRQINVTMIWSYMATSDAKQIGDPRIGYNSPEYWPWNKDGDGKFILDSFNPAYFTALENFVAYANSKDIVFLICIHDGWTKTLFDQHPFNTANGGPLTSNGQYVEFASYTTEMPTTYNPGWTRQQKNQYYQERFTARLIEAVGDYPNVMFEISNEGEWYNTTNYRAYQVHLLNFIRARTDCPTMVNDDHVGGTSFRFEANCDILDMHKPLWDSSSSAKTFFDAYAGHYNASPGKPIFFGEPVKSIAPAEWRGEPELIDPMMRVMWGTVLAAAGFVHQNDVSWGFDPGTLMVNYMTNWNILADRTGHCARFFNSHVLNLAGMTPNGSLASTGVCLANNGMEYAVYSQSGSSFTVNLSAANGTLYCRFYNPRTGVFGTTFTRTGGSSVESFTKPDSSDWVLHIVSTQSPLSPIITAVVPDPDTIAYAGVEYAKQLQTQQGASPISWSVVQGPAGLTVDSSGLVKGWTPLGCDVDTLITLEIEAQNAYGSDTEIWQVQPQIYYMADNVVNLADLVKMAEEWLSADSDLVTDVDCSGKVDLVDFATLAQNWLYEVLELEITNLICPGGDYVVVYDDLNAGKLMYVDRTYSYYTVPAAYQNKTYLQTGNDEKNTSGDSLITFDVNMPVTVYVAHDDRITTKPSWLTANFTLTGDDLVSGSNDREHLSLYRRDYNANDTVMLGGNGGTGYTCSMYTVVVIPQ